MIKMSEHIELRAELAASLGAIERAPLDEEVALVIDERVNSAPSVDWIGGQCMRTLTGSCWGCPTSEYAYGALQGLDDEVRTIVREGINMVRCPGQEVLVPSRPERGSYFVK